MIATVNHVEIPVLDLKKAKEFFDSVFNWDIDTESMGGGYGLYEIKDSPSLGFPVWEMIPEIGIQVVFEVESIDETLKVVKKKGGKVHKAKYEIAPNIGSAAEFIDCFGNRLGLFTPPGK